MQGCCATDPGVESSNPGSVNQINHVSSKKMYDFYAVSGYIGALLPTMYLDRVIMVVSNFLLTGSKYFRIER